MRISRAGFKDIIKYNYNLLLIFTIINIKLTSQRILSDVLLRLATSRLVDFFQSTVFLELKVFFKVFLSECEALG